MEISKGDGEKNQLNLFLTPEARYENPIGQLLITWRLVLCTMQVRSLTCYPLLSSYHDKTTWGLCNLGDAHRRTISWGKKCSFGVDVQRAEVQLGKIPAVVVAPEMLSSKEIYMDRTQSVYPNGFRDTKLRSSLDSECSILSTQIQPLNTGSESLHLLFLKCT